MEKMGNKDYTNGFIDSCCVCNIPLITKKRLQFYQLLGSEQENYCQHIAICPHCGLIVTQNPFSIEQLNKRYKNMSKFEYDAEEYILGLTDSYKKQCDRQKNFINESIGENAYQSILEVGAASGYNLSLYGNKIRKGIEPSTRNCELAKSNYGIDMFNGMWTEFLQQDGKHASYDLIFLSMVLEHIVNPYHFIQECISLSCKYIFIEVPTLDYRVQDEPYGMFCEEHVNIFTLYSLLHLMNNAGFSLCNCEIIFNFEAKLPAGYPAIMTIFKRNDSGDNFIYQDMYLIDEKLDQYLKGSARLLMEIEDKIKKIPDRFRLALWGIGHHASMLISNTSLAKKNIVRIYDNDWRKKGMKFLGHAMMPFELKDAELHTDAILVTTYTAQNQILSTIEKSGYKGKVYTLYD